MSRTMDRLGAADPVALDVVWTRLLALVNEQAVSLQRTAFSPVVREAGDCSVGFFGIDGRMIGQAATGTPGHVLALPDCVKYLVSIHPPETLAPGDVIMTNDPYRNCGHQNDITVCTPVFKDGKAIALYASTCHVPDIGGMHRGGPNASDVFEEGVLIPALKLYRKGVLNEDLVTLIRANVRQPNPVMGDINALVGTNEIGGKRVLEYMDELGISDLVALEEEIISRSERAMREAIRTIPPGTYEHAIDIDGVVEQEPTHIQVKVIVKADGTMHIDYTGSSPKSRYPINVVLNYTHAYTHYALKCAIATDLPNNAGLTMPVTMHAPEGSILCAKPPSPIGGRTRVGHFLPALLFGALAKAIPDRITAESVGFASITVTGVNRSGHPFVQDSGMTNGGTGARPNKDGLSSTGWPHGARHVPTEIVEASAPIIFHRHELRTDSGGPGKMRGGLGQIHTLEVLDTNGPYRMRAYAHCVRYPARGRFGGAPGATTRAYEAKGRAVTLWDVNRLEADAVVTLESGGGGGFFPPFERDPARVLSDVIDGYVSLESARQDYGVAIDDRRTHVDEKATAELRREPPKAR
jgi:N-methylhydantoinase B